MTKTNLYLIVVVILFSTACNNPDNDNEDVVIQTEVQNPAETRRVELIDKVTNGTISLSEQEKLDSLENEKYKKELKNTILNMTEKE